MRLYHSRQIPSESGASIFREWYSLNHIYTITNTALINMMEILSLSLLFQQQLCYVLILCHEMLSWTQRQKCMYTQQSAHKTHLAK